MSTENYYYEIKVYRHFFRRVKRYRIGGAMKIVKNKSGNPIIKFNVLTNDTEGRTRPVCVNLEYDKILGINKVR